jgi:hypothetical protein
MAQTDQPEGNTTQFDRKSGKGGQDGVVSELTTFWTIKPGHEADMRAAVARFEARIRSIGPEGTTKTGIRDVRIAIFDNGTRALFATHFETDWDPYIDDIILIVGLPAFLDWVQYTVEGTRIMDWAEKTGIAKRDPNDPSLEDLIKRGGGEFKALIQEDAQVGCSVYVNVLSEWTVPEIAKAARVNQAFQQVLDDPAAAAALQQPALKPLLDQAAD